MYEILSFNFAHKVNFIINILPSTVSVSYLSLCRATKEIDDFWPVFNAGAVIRF